MDLIYKKTKKKIKLVMEIECESNQEFDVAYSEVGFLYEKITNEGKRSYSGQFTFDGQKKYYVKFTLNDRCDPAKHHPNYYLWQTNFVDGKYQPDTKIGSFWYVSYLEGLLTGVVELSGTKFKVAILHVQKQSDKQPDYKILWEVSNEVDAPKESEIERKKIPQSKINNQDDTIPY